MGHVEPPSAGRRRRVEDGVDRQTHERGQIDGGAAPAGARAARQAAAVLPPRFVLPQADLHLKGSGGMLRHVKGC